MQVPFPPLYLPPGPHPVYPVLTSPPYDAGKSVRLAQMDSSYSGGAGGAWYNNAGDFGRLFTDDLPRQFTDPQSTLRSGRFFTGVENALGHPLATSAAAYLGPNTMAGLQGARTGLRSFRAITGLGRPRRSKRMRGGARVAPKAGVYAQAAMDAQERLRLRQRQAGLAARAPGVAAARGIVPDGPMYGPERMPADYVAPMDLPEFGPEPRPWGYEEFIGPAERPLDFVDDFIGPMERPPDYMEPYGPAEMPLGYVAPKMTRAAIRAASAGRPRRRAASTSPSAAAARAHFASPTGPAAAWRAFQKQHAGEPRAQVSALWRAQRGTGVRKVRTTKLGFVHRTHAGYSSRGHPRMHKITRRPTKQNLSLKKGMMGRERMRYNALKRKAAQLGLHSRWHSSKGTPWSELSSSGLDGHPYGTQWRSASGRTIHGSGRIYG